MPAPVERPDDVHHRPDRRDDDADVLRKPGPPHLRRPRDPDPQTARRGRRNEVVSPDRKRIQRRDAETRRSAQRKTKTIDGRCRILSSSGLCCANLQRLRLLSPLRFYLLLLSLDRKSVVSGTSVDL